MQLAERDPELARQFLTFVWSLEVTRVLSIATGVALVVTTGALLARSRPAYAWLAALALGGIVVVALTGHSAGSASHEDAVNSLGVHLVGVTVWVGGLLAIAVMQPRIGSDLGATVAASIEAQGLPRIDHAEVIVRRLPHVYPLYRPGFETDLAELTAWVDAHPRLVTFGRQGLFVPDNTHHALAMGWAAADALGADGTFDRPAWAAARDRFATHVVED